MVSPESLTLETMHGLPCGGFTGEPHLGNHAWPTMNNALLTFVPDEKVDDILAQLKAMDEETPDLGIRAFVWNIEKYY